MNLRNLNNQSSGLSLWVIVAALLFTTIMYCPAPSFAGGGPNVGGAKLRIKQNNLEEAEEVLLKEVQQVNENNEDAWYLLGYVYARQKRFAEMMDAFDKALALKPKFAEKGIKIGGDSGPDFHSKQGVKIILNICWANAFNAAVKHYNDAAKATEEGGPYFGDAIGMSSDEVIDKYGEPETINVTEGQGGKSEQWVYGLSSLVYLKDDIVTDTQYSKPGKKVAFGKAIEMFKASAKIQPDSLMSYRNWAAALMNAGRSDESVEPLTAALRIAPKDVDLSLMLAQVYMNSRQDSLARPILEGLWAEDMERSAEVADMLSRIYIASGDDEKASEIYIKAIEDNPDKFHFRYNYGTILLEAKNYDGSIEQFKKALEIDSTSSNASYNLGAAYLNRGVSKREALPDDSEDKAYLSDFEAAFPYLEKTISDDPDNLDTWFTLGRIAGQLNKIALAGYAFAKGEPEKSALDDKVRVGMPGETLKLILGEPDKVKTLESEQFSGIEEWIYNERAAAKGKIAVPEPLNIYVSDGRVDALIIAN